MAKTERQLQKALDKGDMSLDEFQRALSAIGTARHVRDIAKKKNRASMSSSKWS